MEKMLFNLLLINLFVIACVTQTQALDDSNASFPSLSTISRRIDEVLISQLEGTYECTPYTTGELQHLRNDWHDVTITRATPNTLTWTNRAGVSWTLGLRGTANDYETSTLSVHPDCPYYTDGYQVATIHWFPNGAVDYISGPWDEPYARIRSAEEVMDLIVGKYENVMACSSGFGDGVSNTVSKISDIGVRWDNPAGSWNLELVPSINGGYKIEQLATTSGWPGFEAGRTTTAIEMDIQSNKVALIRGPNNEKYYKIPSF